MSIITIVKGDRRRQCAAADFAHFAARGFEKAAVPAAEEPETLLDKRRSRPRVEPLGEGHPAAEVPSTPVA